jgi:hypothetical protein
MHIGGALVFDRLPGGGTPAIGKVRKHLEQRLDLLPRYRQKLAVGDGAARRADGRPMGAGVETHHCLVDGGGSVDVVDLLLDAEPAPSEPPAPHGARLPASVEARHAWLPHPPEPVRQTAGTGLAAARSGAHARMHPREALERSRAVLHVGLARSLFAKRLSNLTITNIPGPPRRLHAFGAPMVNVVPIVPLAAEHAVRLAVVSYAGGVTFGLCADRATVPDLDVLRDGIVTSLRELSALAHATAAAR